MKSLVIASAFAAAHALSVDPTRTEKQLPKRAGLPPVTVSGNAFFANGQRFYVRGIDYQPGGSSGNEDPLADTAICGRDIPKFKELGVNTIRVYSTDNSKNHDACMRMLDESGIYLVVDVNNPRYSINRNDPHPSYNTQYLQSIFATVEEFAKYDNTMAFFSGNEVINEQPNTTVTAPYVKAVTRDIKNYMNSRGLRHVPVGYSAADVMENRMQTAMYMNCGSDDARSDFFAFNDYSWCNTDFKTAGWDQKVRNFTDYGIPIFLSEYGCTSNGRDFNEIQALMSSDMTGVYSGGLMYEYSSEGNDWGIVHIKGNDVELTDGYKKFAAAMSKYPAPTGSGGAAATTHGVACPTSDSIWEVDPTILPVMPKNAEAFMRSGAGAGPGLEGPGSQDASGSGTSDTDAVGGVASPSASSTNKPNAASGLVGSVEKGPLVVAGLTVMFTLFGAFLV